MARDRSRTLLPPAGPPRNDRRHDPASIPTTLIGNRLRPAIEELTFSDIHTLWLDAAFEIFCLSPNWHRANFCLRAVCGHRRPHPFGLDRSWLLLERQRQKKWLVQPPSNHVCPWYGLSARGLEHKISRDPPIFRPAHRNPNKRALVTTLFHDGPC